MRARALNWASTLLLVAGAGLWVLAPGALGLTGAAALWFGIVSAIALQAWRLLRERRIKRRNLLTTATTVYRSAKGLDPVGALGLHESRLARRAAAELGDREDGLPPYVGGAIDDAIDRALEHPFTLIVGNALGGKSRAAYEAIRRCFPRAEIWVPAGPRGLRELLSLDPPPALGWRTVVVWLDRLDRYFEGDDTATEALFARHLGRGSRWPWRAPRIVFLATVSCRAHDGLIDRASFEGGRPGADHGMRVMGLAEKVVAADDVAAGWDMDEARRLYPAVDFAQGLGRTFAEAEALLAAYRLGAPTVGRAIVRAAVDWQRVAGEWPTREGLWDLLPVELPGKIVSEADLDQALRWANQAVAGEQRLLGELRDGSPPRYQAHAYLLDADDGYDEHVEPRPVPDGAWEVAAASLEAAALVTVAERAMEYDPGIAERILVVLIDAGAAPGGDAGVGAEAAFTLGAMLLNLPDRERDAEACLMRASDGPDAEIRVRALTGLAQMLRGRRDREDEAEARFAAAIEAAGTDGRLRAIVQLERGQSRQRLDRLDAAAADFAAVIENTSAEPAAHAWAHLHRATIYEEQERPEEQLAELTAAIELNADSEVDGSAYAQRGELHDEPELRLDDFARALATEASPRWHALALAGRGETLAGAGEPEPAEAAYEAAIAVDGLTADEWASHVLNRVVTFGGRDPERDRADCRTVIEFAGVRDDVRARAHRLRASIAMDALPRLRRPGGLLERIAADLAAAIELDDGEHRAESLFMRGSLLEHGYGTVETALDDYAEAIATPGAPPHARGSSHIHRGLIFLSEGRPEWAERELTMGIEIPDLTPHSLAVGFCDRGTVRDEQGRNAEAEADYRAAIAVPDGGEPAAGALKYLCDLLRSEGRFGDELKVCKEAARSGRAELVAVALPLLKARRRWRKRVARSYGWLLGKRGAQPRRDS